MQVYAQATFVLRSLEECRVLAGFLRIDLDRRIFRLVLKLEGCFPAGKLACSVSCSKRTLRCLHLAVQIVKVVTHAQRRAVHISLVKQSDYLTALSSASQRMQQHSSLMTVFDQARSHFKVLFSHSDFASSLYHNTVPLNQNE